MSVCVVGINHRAAPFDIRAPFSIGSHDLMKATVALSEFLGGTAVCLLSTCNRMEIYAGRACPYEVIRWWSQYTFQSEHVLLSLSYKKTGAFEVLQHLIEVCSGADSLLMGETQIHGQLKQAYSMALSSKRLHGSLKKLFELGFSATKTFRSRLCLFRQSPPPSIGRAVAEWIENQFETPVGGKILLLGAGETASLVAAHFPENWKDRLFVCNRTLEKALKLVPKERAFTLKDLPVLMKDCVLLINAVETPEPILSKTMALASIAPWTLIDVGGPRVIENDVKFMEKVNYVSIDMLTLPQVEKFYDLDMIQQEAWDAWQKWQLQECHKESVKEYRCKMDEFKKELETKALQRLECGHDPSEILREFSYKLTQKLLHWPSMALKGNVLHSDLTKNHRKRKRHAVVKLTSDSHQVM